MKLNLLERYQLLKKSFLLALLQTHYTFYPAYLNNSFKIIQDVVVIFIQITAMNEFAKRENNLCSFSQERAVRQCKGE